MSDSDESDTDDTGSTTSSWSSHSNNQPNYRQFASQLQLSKAAGPDFPTNAEQILFQNPKTMAPYVSDTSGVSIPKLTTTKTAVTSIIMLDSRNRDIYVYPQPTNLVLRLPRTYKNISNFQLVQINMLSSFFYFRADKSNLSITIQEQGRYLQDTLGVTKDSTNSTLYPITTKIREGTYTIDTLVAELNLQLNRTPIFYDFINGINDFAPIFIASGDYSLNFNQPGDNFYDSLNNIFNRSPTITQIVQHYFQSSLASLTSYTSAQVKVAYYYPVVKEILLDIEFGEKSLNLKIANTAQLLTDETVFTRSVYTFQGLDDIIVQQVIDINIPILDAYRIKHTFRYSLINQYTVSYSTNNNRISITSSGLNTSLLTLLNTKYTQYFTNQLTISGLSIQQYTTQTTLNTVLLAVLNDMYKYLQTQVSVYFGINFNSYSLAYYTNLSNQLPLQDGLYSQGVNQKFNLSVITLNTSNILLKYQAQSPQLWPQLTELTTSYSNVSSNTNPYNIINDTIDSRSYVNSNGVLYQNPIFKSVTMVTDINPQQYTVFSFKSSARQTLKVTTLPRPTKYRYLGYNSNYSPTIKALFDASYSFIDKANIDSIPSTNPLRTLPGFASTDTNYPIYRENSLLNWGLSLITFNPIATVSYFTFWTPSSPLISGPHKYTLNFAVSYPNDPTIIKPTITTVLFLYHDRAAFMADVTNVRNENPLHYKAKWIISPTANNMNYGVLNTPNSVSDPSYSSLYAGQQYYLIFRTQNASLESVQLQNFILSPYFSLPTTPITLSNSLVGFDPLANPQSNLTNLNYALVNDPDYIRLPTTSNLWSTGSNVDSNYSVFGTIVNSIGYDSNNISTDLTDYVGYTESSNMVPSSQTRIDPITKNIFFVGSGQYYNSTTQLYLDSNSAFGNGNKVVSPINPTLTTISPTTRETSIVHWYSQVFILNTANQPYVSPNDYFKSPISAGVGSNLISYPYVQDLLYPNIFSQASNSGSLLLPYSFQDRALSLGDGIIGISLIPDDGVWDVNRIMLKSAYINSNVDANSSNIDTNRDIKYLGIFPSCYINTLLNTQISLSNATMTFEFSSATTYSNSTEFDRGTYYEWIKKSGKQYLNGYSQTPGKMMADSNAFYSIVPFTADSNLTTYSLLSGSLVPYPFYSDVNTSLTYLDGSKTPTGTTILYPTTKSNADPTLGPPTGVDQTQSKYEQSIPIGSTLLQYLQPPSQFISSAFDISGVTVLQNVIGSAPFTNICFRVQGYILYNDKGDYIIYNYDRNVISRIFYEHSDESNLTEDAFFTNYPNTQVVAISGNRTVFAFLGVFATEYPNQAPGVYIGPYYAYTFIIEVYDPVAEKINIATKIVVNTPITPQLRYGLLGTSGNPLYQNLAGKEIVGVDSFNYNDSGGFTFVIKYRTLGETTITTLGITKGSSVEDTTIDALPFILVESPSWVAPGSLPATYQILQGTYEPFGRFYIVAKTIFATVTVTATGIIDSSVLTLSTGGPFIVGDVLTATGITSLTTVISIIDSNTYNVSGTTSLAFTSITATRSKPTQLKYNVREPMLVNSVLRDANNKYSQNGIFYVNPTNGTFNLSDISINLSNIQAPRVYTSNTTNTSGPSIIRINISQDSTTEAAFGDITLLQNPYENKIMFSYDMLNMNNSTGLPSVTLYQGSSYTSNTSYSSNLSYIPTPQVIRDLSNNPICPYQILGGGGGSFWMLFNEANRKLTTPNNFRYNTVWGNRGDDLDFPVNISNAYQIFYPTQRIVMTKIARSYNPLTDLSGSIFNNSPQILYPEYPHTAIFAYDSESKFITDISSNKWGIESASNYISANYDLSAGYYFNACDFNIPLLSDTTYYIALRGYSPSEKSQVLTRFSLPNKYDFGYLTIQQLSDEIQLSQTQPTLFNTNYLNVIQQFNSQFILPSYIFGSNVVPGYGGSNYTNITGFSDFLGRFISLNNQYNTNLSVLSTINTTTQSNLQTFIQSDLSTIIPASAINRQRYTDPIVYSILWNTSLASQYRKLQDSWGLGWNLGYDKVDTPYLTTHVAPSFYKILDEYINLRLNPEFNMNHMDTGASENLQITKDPTGSLKAYYGKLLLNSFGFYSQTMISNPIVFQIPIPKIDKLSFTWYDTTGNIINNNDCEWTAVVQVVEQLDIVTPSG